MSAMISSDDAKSDSCQCCKCSTSNCCCQRDRQLRPTCRSVVSAHLKNGGIKEVQVKPRLVRTQACGNINIFKRSLMHSEMETGHFCVPPLNSKILIETNDKSNKIVYAHFPSLNSARNKDFSESTKKQRCCYLTVRSKEMSTFFHLAEGPTVSAFLQSDSCMKISDKFLLAMTFTYFKRAGFNLREYTKLNFFLALYLANDMEEDEEEYKYEIFPWCLGKQWKKEYPKFIRKRDELLIRIDFRALVSRKCCEEVMKISPDHPIWKRERPIHHAGAVRAYALDAEDFYPRGPGKSPRICDECDMLAELLIYDKLQGSDKGISDIISRNKVSLGDYDSLDSILSTNDENEDGCDEFLWVSRKEE